MTGGKTSASFDNIGFQISPSATAGFTKDGATALYVNRKSSDGTIIEVRKDNTTVGSISVSDANNLSIDCNTTDHAGLTFATENILPRKNSANTDNAVDLGAGSARFKNAYLSGNLYLGGTGTANALDDYEKGTFSPTLNLQSGNFNSSQTKNGNYVKIGDVVVCNCNINLSTHDGGTGTGVGWRVEGFPFTSMNISGGAPSPIFQNNIGDVCGFGRLENNSTTTMIFTSRLNGVATDANLFFTVIYLTA